MSKKVVYVIGSLANKGGGERILTDKMNFLSSHGYYVAVITCFQFPKSMHNVYALSDGVKQINLEIAAHRQYKYKYPIRLWYRWKYHRQLLKDLTETVNAIDPDILIGVSFSLADTVCKIKCKAVKIVESHNNRKYVKGEYLFKDISLLSRVYNYLSRQNYIRTIEKRADIVVALTKGDAYEWRHANRVEVIPNYSSFSVHKISNLSAKRIITAGRLEPQKGYDCLLRIWQIVNERYPDWQLEIYGEGSLENAIRGQIAQLKLENVHLHPFVSDISSEYASSSIFVLTSRYEGFSLVLLEAMIHGVPCVAFDCPFGPKDIIDNDRCGYLVENGDVNQFAQKLSYLIEHMELRKYFAANAIEKSKVFSQDSIMKQWISLFETVSMKKN